MTCDINEARSLVESRGDRMLDAYYYSFEPTGDPHIDLILGAVARAGKMYHHTEMWVDGWGEDDPGCIEVIQTLANAAAAAREDSPT